MNEKLLQFIWNHQFLNTKNLLTTAGEAIHIINKGILNSNEGPDFLQAQIKIDNIAFAGNIELHINADDWYKHLHQQNLQYKNIILHVVWNNNAEITDDAGIKIPQLCLQQYVAKAMLNHYKQLMESPVKIPCSAFLPALNNLAWTSWKERLIVDRLNQKSEKVLEFYKQTNHWEEVFWWMIAQNFGLKINTDLFLSMAQQIPVNLLAKHKNNLLQIEALLFGTANLLNNHYTDAYMQSLKKEYSFLAQKYGLKKAFLQPNYLRLRPASFPTIRLSQLANLICKSSHLFSVIIEATTIADIKKLFKVQVSEYWKTHFTADSKTVLQEKNLGNSTIENIIINTVIPVLYAYGRQYNQVDIEEKIFQWLSNLSAERNSLVNDWQQYHIPNSNAFDSQALLQLTNYYCKPKRCLDCSVGVKILKKEVD